jgi:hypothetical protein
VPLCKWLAFYHLQPHVNSWSDSQPHLLEGVISSNFLSFVMLAEMCMFTKLRITKVLLDVSIFFIFPTVSVED